MRCPHDFHCVGGSDKRVGHILPLNTEPRKSKMKYNIIYADPPWHYGSWGKAEPTHRPHSKVYPMPYQTMSVDDIKALPVGEIADTNCELYLWTTQRYLPVALCYVNCVAFW